MDTTATGRLSVLVVGGGIGGLTAAVALRRLGCDVEVAEIKDDWSVAGWGLSLTGPALRALAALDLAQQCLDLGYGITSIAHCDSAGHEREVTELPSLLGPGRAAQAGIARPDLAAVLRQAAAASGAVLRNSLTVTALREAAGGVTATLSDGTTRSVDLVIAADGVGSRTRQLIGITDTPAFTGQMVWRAVVPRPSWAVRLFTFAGTTHNAGLIPISAERAYCFVTENTGSDAAVPDSALAEGMRALLASFAGRVTGVRESITDPSQVVRRPVQTIWVDGPWHLGRTLLIGDAAHTPSPQMVSGAALAIEDAVILAEELAAAAGVAEALSAFESRRRARARLVVDTSVQIGRAEQQGRHADVYALQGKCHAALAAPA